MGLVFKDLGLKLAFQYLEDMGDQNFLHTYSILYYFYKFSSQHL